MHLLSFGGGFAAVPLLSLGFAYVRYGAQWAPLCGHCMISFLSLWARAGGSRPPFHATWGTQGNLAFPPISATFLTLMGALYNMDKTATVLLKSLPPRSKNTGPGRDLLTREEGFRVQVSIRPRRSACISVTREGIFFWGCPLLLITWLVSRREYGNEACLWW